MKRLLAAALVLIGLSSPAFAVTRVWISEFSSIPISNNGGPVNQVGQLPAVANQQLDISGGVQSSAALNTATRFVRIVCELQCAAKVGGTAATTDTLIPALKPEYFGVPPGAAVTISVILAP